MSTSESMSHDEAISQFCAVTGADEDRAKALLDACEWNLELAINMHVDTDPEGRSNRIAQQQSTSASTSTAASATMATINNVMSRPAHRNNPLLEDNDGDDEDSLNIDGQDSDPRGGRFAARSRLPAAMRRFNAGTSSAESSAAEATSAYSNLVPDSDGVRPPIAPVRQILNPNPIGYPAPDLSQMRRGVRTAANVSSVQDAFRNFQAEAEWQELYQQGEAGANGSAGGRTLQALFRPPLDLMFRGEFTSARDTGTTQNKWLLVNIQSGREFACQVLNRDVWSHQTVKDIIKEHFIFWQVYNDSHEGMRYVQFYHVSKLPYVAIIDPRTGELMRSWPTSIDHNSFCDSVIEFLSEHPSPDGSAPDANTMKKLRVKEDDDDDIEQDDDEPQIIVPRATMYDQSEEAQLEAAIRASLQEPEKKDINDTIEIDDDTMEASDVSEPEPVAARDRDQLDKLSSASDSNSNSRDRISVKSKQGIRPSDNLTSPESGKQATQANNNSNIKPTDDQPEISAADALKDLDYHPVKTGEAECRIALRFPDGSSHIQKFSASEQLKSVKMFVEMGKPVFRSSKIEFVAPPNRKFSETKMEETLEDLGLCPASRLEVKFVQD